MKLHRIPHGRNFTRSPESQIVLLQHGLLCSSIDWVITGPERSLAFILADAGYDVWMGNFRGNSHSRNHLYLTPETKSFWDFSWHEMGLYDLPAMIDYVLAQTNKSQLHYIGHSQGTTSFFVMASMRSEYNQHIRTMNALSPIAFMSHLKSPIVRLMAIFIDEITWVLKMLGVYEFLPSSELLIQGGSILCNEQSPFIEVCANVLFLIGGYNSKQLDRVCEICFIYTKRI